MLPKRPGKLTAYGLLDKQVFAELPPRTKYVLTHNGQKLVAIIDQLRSLDDEIRST
jgi:DNA-binding HxlR family transcriptional regulator